jgi:hypothetical protein|eukprot:SAG25_NODE_280_length_10460_cov_116.317923_2_plen_340_part_00
MAISRMQEPRQLYGLGSLVKSIGKTVKKVVKSDLGKAALLAAVGFGIPGTQFGGLLGRASFGGAAPSIFGKTGGISALLSGGTKFLPGSTAAMKGAAVTTPGIFGSIPGGGYTVGAIGSILAASGMSPEEIEETKRDPEKVKIYLRDYYSKTNPDASSKEVEEFVTTNTSEYMAVGGRVGLESGTPKKGLNSLSIKDMEKYIMKMPYIVKYDEDGNPIRPEFPRKGEPHKYNPDKKFDRKNMPFILPLKRNKLAMGGLQSMPMGQMRKNKAGTIERDYRETGGFVPVGIKEKADDVPAMLSKNEFVMTADAVRGMGGGNIEKGAQRLYDQMKQAEKRVV